MKEKTIITVQLQLQTICSYTAILHLPLATKTQVIKLNNKNEGKPTQKQPSYKKKKKQNL